jgi:hypothetical protein
MRQSPVVNLIVQGVLDEVALLFDAVADLNTSFVDIDVIQRQAALLGERA